MKKLIFATSFPLFLAACAGAPPAPGTPITAVEAQLGQPTGRYSSGPDTMLEYAKGPAGQYTFMARIGPDGRLVNFEQVLTTAKFATIRPGRDDKTSVLRTIGRPAKQVHYASVDGDVWQYRYKEQDVWDSVMDVQFDRKGVVQALVNGPDPEREPPRFR